MSISNTDVTTSDFRSMLCTDRLRTRASRVPDYLAENAALIKLANRMSTTPLKYSTPQRWPCSFVKQDQPE